MWMCLKHILGARKQPAFLLRKRPRDNSFARQCAGDAKPAFFSKAIAVGMEFFDDDLSRLPVSF